MTDWLLPAAGIAAVGGAAWWFTRKEEKDVLTARAQPDVTAWKTQIAGRARSLPQNVDGARQLEIQYADAIESSFMQWGPERQELLRFLQETMEQMVPTVAPYQGESLGVTPLTNEQKTQLLANTATSIDIVATGSALITKAQAGTLTVEEFQAWEKASAFTVASTSGPARLQLERQFIGQQKVLLMLLGTKGAAATDPMSGLESVFDF